MTCDGKVALVTGTSRGLGKAIAKRLAAEGATVALTARTAEPDPKYQGSLSQTLAEIEQAGGSAIAVPADLAKPEDRERLVAAAFSQRRKTLRNAASAVATAEAFARAAIDPGRRGETLSVGEVIALCNAIG